MKLALVVHPERAEAAEVAAAVERVAVDTGMDSFRTGSDATGADLVVTVGGDGTLLLGSLLARAIDVPVVGIDVGQVGYLADVEPEQVEEAVRRIAAGDYRVVERATVAATWDGAPPAVGINDVVVEKVISQHALRLLVSIDGTDLVHYRADGVIVATPLGSTAYAYSAGGPIVHPGTDVLVLAAVAPHNFHRTVVLRGDAVVALTVEGTRPGRVNVDGMEVATIDPGISVTVRRGDHPAKFAEVFGTPFAGNARAKLHVDPD